MREYHPRTRRQGDILEVGNTLHQLKSNGSEQTEPGYIYQVEIFSIVGELGEVLDAAHAKVAPGCFTPPQLVVADTTILDFPIAGQGTFVCLRPNGDIEACCYDSNNPEHDNFTQIYGKGCYIFWKSTGDTPLEFIELCNPVYTEGTLKNLDMNDTSVPSKFRKAFEAISRTS